LQIDGCDGSPYAVAYARQRAAQAGASLGFFVFDVSAGPIPDGYDVVTASLFLHHLDDAPALALLARMARAAGQLVVINDLERSRRGWLLARAATRALTRSRVVHADGPASVRSAYTMQELSRMAEQAGLHGARISRRWPCRMQLSWRKP